MKKLLVLSFYFISTRFLLIAGNYNSTEWGTNTTPELGGCHAVLTLVSITNGELVGFGCENAFTLNFVFNSNVPYTTWTITSPEESLFNDGTWSAAHGDTIHANITGPSSLLDSMSFFAAAELAGGGLGCAAAYYLHAPYFVKDRCDHDITITSLTDETAVGALDGGITFNLTTSSCNTDMWSVALDNTDPMLPDLDEGQSDDILTTTMVFNTMAQGEYLTEVTYTGCPSENFIINIGGCTHYRDFDGDGFGDPDNTVVACGVTAPAGYVDNKKDCDDADPAINPNASEEMCNNIDDNCNGVTDEGSEALYITFYEDADGDTYGKTDVTLDACIVPPGYAIESGDCNDANGSINPGVIENTTNGIDDNCNGVIDELVPLIAYYADFDHDGYGNHLFMVYAEEGEQPTGYITDDTDCDDTNADVNPGHTTLAVIAQDTLNSLPSVLGGVMVSSFIGNMELTSDGGSIAIGTTYLNGVPGYHPSVDNFEDVWVVKKDAAGNIQWQRAYGGSGIDGRRYFETAYDVYAIQQTFDGGYIFSAQSNSSDGDLTANPFTGNPSWIVKLDNAGNIQWQTRPAAGALPSSIKQTSDAGFIVCGRTSASDAAWVSKLTAGGATVWTQTYGDGPTLKLATDIVSTSDGSYAFCGIAPRENPDDPFGISDYWIVKLNNSGSLIWQKKFGTLSSDFSNKIVQAADGSITVCGTVYSDLPGTSGDATGLHGGLDLLLLNLDLASGDINWQKALGGTGYELSISLTNALDGGFIIGASTTSSNGDVHGYHGGLSPDHIPLTDYWLVKTDSVGNWQKQRTLGGTKADDPIAAFQLTDSTYLISGRSFSINGDVIQSGDNIYGTQWTAVLKEGEWGDFCNGIDDDCDGQIDEQAVVQVWYADADVDDFGDAANFINSCENSVNGYTLDDNDCNDADPAINPHTIWYLDADNDQYYIGDGIAQCLSPGAHYKIYDLLGGNDCNDANASKWQNTLLYVDADNDDWGVNQSMVCMGNTLPFGYKFSTWGPDCNDANAMVNPAQGEVCNTIDDNCNGTIDEGIIDATITPTGNIKICPAVGAILSTPFIPGYSYSWKLNNASITGATNANYTALTAGSYKVTITTPGGCTATTPVVKITVSVVTPASITPLTSLSTCIAPSNTVRLQANSGTGLTYQWRKGLTDIAGATKKTYNTTKPGNFSVKTTNADGCISISPSVAVSNVCRDENSFTEDDDNLNVYPNPAQQSFTVELQLSKMLNTTAFIHVFNMTGQLMYTAQTQIADGELNDTLQPENQLPSGLYIIQMQADGKLYSANLVIMR